MCLTWKFLSEAAELKSSLLIDLLPFAPWVANDHSGFFGVKRMYTLCVYFIAFFFCIKMQIIHGLYTEQKRNTTKRHLGFSSLRVN